MCLTIGRFLDQHETHSLSCLVLAQLPQHVMQRCLLTINANHAGEPTAVSMANSSRDMLLTSCLVLTWGEPSMTVRVSVC